MIGAVMLMAIVTRDHAVLHGAPRDSSPRHAILYQGDVLEVRGERSGYLEVYDHRHERAGFLRAWQAKTYPLQPESAPELLAVVRFLKDTPGDEALGIACAAMFLRAADAKAIDAEVFDAIGTMAERLARRASRRYGAADELDAAHLDVASSFGVKFESFTHAEQTRVCYEGDAFRRVLALSNDPTMKARAALALTRPECAKSDDSISERERIEIDRWRGEVLDRIDDRLLAPYLSARMHVRRATVLASIAFDRARTGDLEGARSSGERAIAALAGVDRRALSEDDLDADAEAAIHVGANRWIAAPPIDPQLPLAITRGEDAGETCVAVGDAKRCTFGIAFPASIVRAPKDAALALAVQPKDGWLELWIAHRIDDAWRIDVLVPSAGSLDLANGYIEHAGWSPDGTRFIVAREVKGERSFEVIRVDTLETVAKADRPSALKVFKKWRTSAWAEATIALR
jgi:hypothetical protein